MNAGAVSFAFVTLSDGTSPAAPICQWAVFHSRRQGPPKIFNFGGPWCAQLHSRQWSAKLEFSVRQRETHWSTRGSVELHKFRHIEEKYPEPLHRNSSGLFTNRCQTVVQAIFFNLDSFMPMESSISSAAKCITHHMKNKTIFSLKLECIRCYSTFSIRYPTPMCV